MTFTEAAVEVLRRAGRPLHFKEIATMAVEAGLLSHVGQTPEATMGARLLAMARREHDRKVVATDTGVFGLSEWGIAPQTPALEGPGGAGEGEGEQPYRARERHPPLQDEYVVGARRDERRRRAEGEEEEGRRKKRFPPPAEVAHAWLRDKREPAALADVARALREQEKIAEALERDLHSFERALREENRRRQDSGRPLLFDFRDDGTVVGLELPKEAPKERREPAPRPEKVEKPPRREEPVKLPALDEQRRAVIRSVRRRIASLDVAAVERVATALLEAQGYRELNMARRSAKEGPLYLARRRWGAGELRYVVRVLRPGRDIGRTEVQELRRDLGHYSAQLGLVLGTAECSREAKSEANTPNAAPVMLYGNEAFAEALVDAGLGVTKRLIEWLDYDDEFFAAAGAGEQLPVVEEAPFPEAPAAAPAPAPAPAAAEPEQREERSRRQRERDRRRERRPRDGDGRADQPPAEGAEAGPAEGSEPAPPAEGAEPAPAAEEAGAAPAAGPAGAEAPETAAVSGEAPAGPADLAEPAPPIEERPSPAEPVAAPEPAPPPDAVAPPPESVPGPGEAEPAPREEPAAGPEGDADATPERGPAAG